MLLSAFPISKASHYCSSPLPSHLMHFQASVLTVPLRRPNGQKKGKGPLPKTRMYCYMCSASLRVCIFLFIVFFCFLFCFLGGFLAPSLEGMSHFDWPIAKNILIPTIKSFFFFFNMQFLQTKGWWVLIEDYILRSLLSLFLVIHKSLTLVAFFLSFFL